MSLVFGTLMLSVYTLYLNSVIKDKFEGRRWSIPAKVYARALEVYPGLKITVRQFEKELQLAGYRKDKQYSTEGSFSRNGQRIELVTRQFDFPDGEEPSHKLRIQFNQTGISSIYDRQKRKKISLMRLDPAHIGSIHPKLHEDRLLLSQDDIPKKLKNTLMAVEDRNFYQHYGVDPKGIARAMWTNIKAGSAVQGGSTLTQQLVKNYFLTRERTLARKLNEAIMSLLLEYHYSKDEIITAYINEVYLGQDGRRAVHGFALASEFYFKRPVSQLSQPQMALLVGLVKGPSYYNPRNHKDRALKRRNTVLKIMLEQGLLKQTHYQKGTKSSLGISGRWSLSNSPFTAFLDSVKSQLKENYDQDDLTDKGLRIFTTLNPQVQWAAENALSSQIKSVNKKLAKQLQGAVVVSHRDSAEILAIVGGKNSQEGDFNRAINARRPIGSLIKPAIYLTAFEQGYTLSSLLNDTSFSAKSVKGKLWSPKNFDKKEHGLVPLHVALAKSYNLSTARLGMDIGVDKVLNTVRSLGVDTDALPYPAVLLGSLTLSPIQVSQMYQTLADQGFYSPLHTILSVQDENNETMQQYPVRVQRRIDESLVYLINANLQEAVSMGTGKGLSQYVPIHYNIAGKTGTTNELRDSWFAGFGDNLIGVVWLGRDDNKPAGLTGSSGALKVWGKMMKQLDVGILEQNQPENIKWFWIDSMNQLKLTGRCQYAEFLPFVQGTEPESTQACSDSQFSEKYKTKWLKRLFQ
ncbi:MAG: penicillin-binding protein 1B [gamma proteobacterium symbiont of Bathyaustriella thionipta]|nr:penicillin-binding protein 1B [gamma proteobacterium symbiont of Bathyaustriella thionipta]MCU7954756.1 penicillin-binding protein 1B [gamma proteobacterium symbiont of Bathyaustriella thionipta]